MSELRITDTLSGELRTLEPREPPKVGIYTCGPTVYSRVHVGNARPFVIPILLQRLLRRLGYEPRLVINITDINDKIYAAAREAGVASDQFAAEMTRAYVEDTDRLGLGRPDAEPLASDTIPEIIELIKALIASEHAYESGGDVYFRVRSVPDYGKLSNRDPEEMDQGEEAGTESLKEDALDFALWKARKPDEDTAWPSPWGEGRPGWHIECSAMAEKLLGTNFAIHSGGSDLVFPHHENEIAQTEAARGEPLARIWMHNGMVRFEGEKMAKSVGNIALLHEALEQYGPQTLGMYFAGGHYRQPLAFSPDELDDARGAVASLRELIRRLDPSAPEPAGLAEHAERFWAHLADDFNTPAARGVLFEWVREANRRLDHGETVGVGSLKELVWALGLESLFEDEAAADTEAERMMAEREEARGERDFERADRLRDELAGRGWQVRDTPQGPRLVPLG